MMHRHWTSVLSGVSCNIMVMDRPSVLIGVEALICTYDIRARVMKRQTTRTKVTRGVMLCQSRVPSPDLFSRVSQNDAPARRQTADVQAPAKSLSTMLYPL
jgi:hypothetical protein